MGIFGGVINYFVLLTPDDSPGFFLAKNIMVALGGSVLVPLFLQTVSSELLVNGFTTLPHYYVFAGLCLIAALLSRILLSRSQSSIESNLADLKHSIDDIYREIRDKPMENRQYAKSPNLLTLEDEGRPKSPKPQEEPLAFSEDVHKILRSLKHSHYVFKTLEEIAEETALRQAYLEFVMEQIKKAGLVTNMRRDEDVLWGLTYKGFHFPLREYSGE